MARARGCPRRAQGSSHFHGQGDYPRILADGGWLECPGASRRIVSQCSTSGSRGELVGGTPMPEDPGDGGPFPIDEVGRVDFLQRSSGHVRELRATTGGTPYRPASGPSERLILPARSEIDGVDDALDPKTLGLVAINDRQLLAWLVKKHEIVRVIRPGAGSDDGDGQAGGHLLRTRAGEDSLVVTASSPDPPSQSRACAATPDGLLAHRMRSRHAATCPRGPTPQALHRGHARH